MVNLDRFIKDFLVETYENLDQLDRDLFQLEQTPGDLGILTRVFRTIHTLKGGSSFFDFRTLGAMTHEAENLLSRMRDAHQQMTPDASSALLAMIAAIREILGHIESTHQEGDNDYSTLINRLKSLASSERATPDAEAMDLPPLVQSAHVPAREMEAPTPQRSKEISTSSAPPESLFPHPEVLSPGIPDSTVRLDVHLLDRLMNLVGELVLSRNQLLQALGHRQGPAISRPSHQLDRVTSELQAHVMRTRLQPIRNIWGRLPRAVRDIARACGKKVQLEMEGGDTELDRTLLEAIRDPITHLIRNAVDHGIETPDARGERNKTAEGRLQLRAFHEGGQIHITVSDDGAGIDAERIRSKAIERGLVSADKAAHLSRSELLGMIFLPGFSTADRVTELSGRGVGMDVVRANIERVGGTIDLQSHPGEGTTVNITIPLTLAIIPALLVTCHGQRYAIPQVSLVELIRLDRTKPSERFHDALVYRLRGRLLPLLDLREAFDLPPADVGEAKHLVVVQAAGKTFGLVVDSVRDTEEIVVKPLGDPLNRLSVYAGATILGDGAVALILDVFGLARQTGVISTLIDPQIRTEAAVRPRGAERGSAILAEVGGSRVAIPLTGVTRLEELPCSALERSAGRDVVQRQGGILRVLRLARALGAVEALPDGRLHLAVYSEDGRETGLIVDRVLDIVPLPDELGTGPALPGLHGSAVIRDRVTDVLDVKALLQTTLP